MMPAIFACSLACTVLFAVFAGPAIRKNPWVCYVPAVVLMAMYWAGAAGMLPQGLREIAFLLMQKGTLAMALFTVVMFVGVFPRGSKARLRLGAARAELSIAACLMICGHMVAYAASYVPRAFTVGFSNPFVVAGLLLAVVLAVLTAVLGVTSLSRVKARMAALKAMSSLKGSAPAKEPVSCSTVNGATQWPVQIRLVPGNAAFLEGADVLVAADCTGYACRDFHARYADGRVLLVGCPKLDAVDYAAKLSQLFTGKGIKSITLTRMTVPCCGGMERAVRLAATPLDIPVRVVTLDPDGNEV